MSQSTGSSAVNMTTAPSGACDATRLGEILAQPTKFTWRILPHLSFTDLMELIRVSPQCEYTVKQFLHTTPTYAIDLIGVQHVCEIHDFMKSYRDHDLSVFKTHDLRLYPLQLQSFMYKLRPSTQTKIKSLTIADRRPKRYTGEGSHIDCVSSKELDNLIQMSPLSQLHLERLKLGKWKCPSTIKRLTLHHVLPIIVDWNEEALEELVMDRLIVDRASYFPAGLPRCVRKWTIRNTDFSSLFDPNLQMNVDFLMRHPLRELNISSDVAHPVPTALLKMLPHFRHLTHLTLKGLCTDEELVVPASVTSLTVDGFHKLHAIRFLSAATLRTLHVTVSCGVKLFPEMYPLPLQVRQLTLKAPLRARSTLTPFLPMIDNASLEQNVTLIGFHDIDRDLVLSPLEHIYLDRIQCGRRNALLVVMVASGRKTFALADCHVSEPCDVSDWFDASILSLSDEDDNFFQVLHYFSELRKAEGAVPEAVNFGLIFCDQQS